MLLYFALVLHFAAIVITFCDDYYILRRNRPSYKQKVFATLHGVLWIVSLSFLFFVLDFFAEPCFGLWKGSLINKYLFKLNIITLSALVAKILNRTLLNCILPVLDPNQNGFSPGRSTTTQILTLRCIMEGVREQNLPSVT